MRFGVGGILALGIAICIPNVALAQTTTTSPPPASTSQPAPVEDAAQPASTTESSMPASYLDAPSPEKIAITPGGVDIRTGRLGYRKTDISIGEGGGSLSLERTTATPIPGHVNPFGNLSHNWDITLLIKAVPIDQYPGQHDLVANVSYGSRSQTFEKLHINDTVFRQKSQNDFTRLTTPGAIGAFGVVYTYQANDGTAAVFRPMASEECSTAAYQCAFVANIVEPDGTRYDFEYETTAGTAANKSRLRAVTSSRGYALLLEYNGGTTAFNQVTKACVINLAFLAKPADNACPAGALAVATYGYSADSLGPALGSATGPDNATETFQFTDVVPGTSHKMAQIKPGQAAPWATHSMESSFTSDGDKQPIVVSQQFVDGSGFVYGYNYTPETSNGSGMFTSYQTIAGGYYSNALGEGVAVEYDFPAIPYSMSPPRVIPLGGGQTLVPYVNYGDIVYQVTPGPARVTDPLGRVTTYHYCDPNAEENLPPQEQDRCLISLLQWTKNPDGGVTKVKYGTNSNPIELRHIQKTGANPSLPDIVESATYSGDTCYTTLKTCNKPVTVTDNKGIVTDYSWDVNSGNILSETRAAPSTGAVRPQTRYSYVQAYAWYKNASGVLVQSPYPVWLLSQTSQCRSGAAPACVGTADETRTTYSYGPSGSANNLLPVSVTVAAGNGSGQSMTTTFTYDALGNKLTEDGPRVGADDTTRWRYDAARRVVGVIKPDPDSTGPMKFRATRNTYDLAGRLIKVEVGTVNSQSDADWTLFVPLQTVETAYDPLDRKVREWSYGTSGGTQQLTQYSYDLAGRLECTAVRMNKSAYASLPSSACTLGPAGTDGPDRITRLTYNAAGELTKTTLAYGTAEQTDQETNTYTLNGKLATVTDGENNTTTFEYDGHDRLKKTRYPVAALGALTSSTTDFEELTYDANGNVVQHRKRDGQLVGFSYDNLNRIVAKDVPNLVIGEYDVTTTYDNLDRPVLVTDTAGNSVGSSYNALGQMLTQTSPNGTFTLAYDDSGRVKRIMHPDGNYFTYTYNVSDLTIIKQSGTIALATYGYDDLGRRTSITRGNGTVTSYGYDPVGRLACQRQDLAGGGAPLCTPSPSASGNDQAVTFAHLPSGQIGSMTRANDSYAWTAHFNVNRNYGTNGLNQLTSAGATALGYDGRGNLTSSGSSLYSYTTENRLATGPGGVSLYYDPTGRLSRLEQGINTTLFEYLGPRLMTERSANGTILRRYVHGPGDDEPVVWYEGASLADKRWLHTDERGSVVAISDASGASIATNRYDEYGIPQSTNAGRFQFTGQAWMPELGLYYYKARFYSPTLGRFMQTDPIGYKDGINWYAYVHGDPVNKVDPDGMQHDATYDRMAKGLHDQREKGGSDGPTSKPGAAASTVSGAAGATGAAGDGAKNAPSNATVDSNGKVRTGGPNGGPFRGNQHVKAVPIQKLGKAASRVAAPVAGVADFTSQVQSGKPADQAGVNAGAKVGFSALVGGLAAAAAPETLGGSVLVGLTVIGADQLLGGKIGNAAESLYVNTKKVESNESGLVPASP